jgi:Outer membrane protein beta-barrel domain
MRLSRMRTSVFACASLIALLAANRALAQEPPPKIGPFVVDLHATVPRFPQDLQLAQSRAMTLAELPGSGLGVLVGLHFYPLRWRAVTFGVGGEFATGRARQTPTAAQTTLRPATERLTTITPQLSFNFGTGNGWSYITGGLGRSTWAVTPQGQEGFAADSERLKTISYGGGARWFMKTHLAFSFDARFYAINPGTPFVAGVLGSPRTTLIVIGAGVSVR